jgi:LysM repeat protein
MKKSMKKLAAPLLATSLIFGGVITTPISAHHVLAASTYQTELNSFSALYANFVHKMENYRTLIEKETNEDKQIKLYDEFMTLYSKFLDDNYDSKQSKSIQDLEEPLYNTLVDYYNFELDTLDYLEGTITEDELQKKYDDMISDTTNLEKEFTSATYEYKTSHKVVFDNNMLYLLGEDTTYTVKKGDTIYSIAKKYGLTVSELKKNNGLKTDTLKVGQVLKIGYIPVPETTTPTPAPTNNTYTVKKGDTIYSIAKKYGLSVSKLKTMNNLKSDSLKIGQLLKIK